MEGSADAVLRHRSWLPYSHVSQEPPGGGVSHLGEDDPHPTGELQPWASPPRALLLSVCTPASPLVCETHVRVCLCAYVHVKVCESGVPFSHVHVPCVCVNAEDSG